MQCPHCSKDVWPNDFHDVEDLYYDEPEEKFVYEMTKEELKDFFGDVKPNPEMQKFLEESKIYAKNHPIKDPNVDIINETKYVIKDGRYYCVEDPYSWTTDLKKAYKYRDIRAADNSIGIYNYPSAKVFQVDIEYKIFEVNENDLPKPQYRPHKI